MTKERRPVIQTGGVAYGPLPRISIVSPLLAASTAATRLENLRSVLSTVVTANGVLWPVDASQVSYAGVFFQSSYALPGPTLSTSAPRSRPSAPAPLAGLWRRRRRSAAVFLSGLVLRAGATPPGYLGADWCRQPLSPIPQYAR